jgi:hypothetical protein
VALASRAFYTKERGLITGYLLKRRRHNKAKERLKKLPDGEVWSINQTEAYYLREKLLFSSIELKKSRSSDNPLLQLAIWNSELFQRLEGLLDLTGKRDFV